jgi:uncharacterized lipoprotein YmbA
MMPLIQNTTIHTLLIILFMALGTTVFGGCTGVSQPTAYYVLGPSENLSSDLPSLNELAVGVGPIKLPDILDRPHIVTRAGQYRMAVNEFHRWGDSMKGQVSDMLVESLSMLLQTPHVSAYPWEHAFKPDYQIYADIRRFDGRKDGPVVLSMVWWIIDPMDEKRLLTQRFSTTVSIKGSGFEAYVAAQNSALDQLSREMAQGLAGVAGKKQ